MLRSDAKLSRTEVSGTMVSWAGPRCCGRTIHSSHGCGQGVRWSEKTEYIQNK